MAVVLLVDDDPDSSEVVCRFLRRAGHRVTWKQNGHEALSALSNDTPDVVILDARMPEMDGIGFLEVIRCYLRWQTLPVILFTAYAEGTHIRRAIELGVRKTLVKGQCKFEELLAHIETCAKPLPRSQPESHLRLN